jgi:hypothetical protein
MTVNAVLVELWEIGERLTKDIEERDAALLKLPEAYREVYRLVVRNRRQVLEDLICGESKMTKEVRRARTVMLAFAKKWGEKRRDG